VDTRSHTLRRQSKIKLRIEDGNVNRNATLSSEGLTAHQDIRRNRRSRSGSSNNNPADHCVDQVLAQKVRQALNFDDSRKFTPAQCEIIFDDSIESRKYDKISEFGIRPPELVPVVDTLTPYFRWFHISDKMASEQKMKEGLNARIDQSDWYDGFCRRVKVRKRALRPFLEHVERKVEDLTGTQDRRALEINLAIRNMLRILLTDDDSLSSTQLEYKQKCMDRFVHDDKGASLPIIVTSQVNPLNINKWLVHLILSMGSYVTEKDALDHPNIRKCFKHVKLIGTEDDMEHRRQYAKDLCKKYIKSQVIYFPISLNKAEHIIMRAYYTLTSVIVNDSLPMFESSFTISELADGVELQNMEYWRTNNQKLLNSVYAEIGSTNVIGRSVIEACTRADPWDGNPVELFRKGAEQSDESYEEQKTALEHIYTHIKHYCNPLQGRRVNTYTKNLIIQGAPGCGKTFMGNHALLYAMSQGLRVISTAMMAARASVLGGSHLHVLFGLPANLKRNTTINPPLLAQRALERIMKNPKLLNPLLTIDVLFLDEAGQVSAELLATIDIILRTVRNSSTLYGGVYIMGSMDHTQGGPINATPFSMSTQVLTSYTFIKLKHSVRAFSDPPFQRYSR
jgi:hypothetical protein